MTTLISPDNIWILLAVIVTGVALSIYLEQNVTWGARLSGPVLALIIAMVLVNVKVMPLASPTYDMVDTYLVPLAIPLLLFQANLKRIIRATGKMLAAFHVAAVGTLVGAFVAALIFRNAFDQVPEITGIMTGSYIGGGVNFMAVRSSFQVDPNLTNPLIVADNFIMAGMFILLLLMSGSRFLLRHYPHQSEVAEAGGQNRAAQFWKRKNISLLDLAKGLALAFVIAGLSVSLAGWIKGQLTSNLAQSFFGNTFVLITFFTVLLASLFPRWMDQIHGAEEVGTLLLYLFFFVIGLRADLVTVVKNVPVLFLFCLTMAVVNLAVTLLLGKWLRLPLEELLVSVNATLGGAPSAAAMAISKGWTGLVLPALLVGIWGYVIGTFLGILTANLLMRWW